MRILHVIGSLDPAVGGPALVAMSLSAAQSALGHQVRIMTIASPDAREQIATAMKAIPGMDRVAVIDLPRMRWPRFQPDVSGRVSAVVGEVDILQLHAVWEPILLATARIARQQCKPYILTAHGVLDPWSLSQKWLKKRIALLLGYRRMINSAAFIHALNADERQGLEGLKLLPPVGVIPNGIFLEEVDAHRQDSGLGSLLPSVSDAPFILFLGRLHYKKGLDYLAEAFAMVAAADPKVHLVVVGPDGGARAGFEQQISRGDFKSRVHVLGPVYGAQKLAILFNAACFCLPSRQEGLSIAILEALACRAPVVISKACHFPEAAKNDAGHVVDLDPRQIADALLDVLSNPDKARQMGQAGRKLVESAYTWPAVARQSIAVYERVLAGR